MNVEITGQTVISSQGGYEPHPESYFPRVLVYVFATDVYYELLRTGEAVVWENKNPEGFDFWIIDVKSAADVGVHRDKPGIEPHVSHEAANA